MILLQAYLYYSILRRITFEVLTWSSDAATVGGNIFGTSVVEEHSMLLSYFVGCFQYPEILVPLKQTLFLETPRNHSEAYQGNGVGVPFQ
jgi:hypothetical protein